LSAKVGFAVESTFGGELTKKKTLQQGKQSMGQKKGEEEKNEPFGGGGQGN